LKIAVNTRLLLENKLEGLGWFTYETFKRITVQHPEHEFIFIFDRPYNDEFIFSKNVTPVVIPPQARHPLFFYLWFEFSIPYILKKTKADIFVSPDGYLSLSAKTPSLAVMHDLNFEHYPKDLPWIIRKYYAYFFPRFARKANRIATVSEFSKQDIIQSYQISKDKIDVVYNGVNELYVPVSEALKESARKKYSDGKPYFVFVGALHSRKNIVNLLKAFDLFRKKINKEIKFILVGEKKWWTVEMEKTYCSMQFKNDVIFTGRLYNEELNLVIGSALAMTYVSTFEGFGIPILEAYRCEVPVITSNVTSMPEVAVNGALYADPFSYESICDAMENIVNNPMLCKKLIENGIHRSKDFSWQKTADKLWLSIENTLRINQF